MKRFPILAVLAVSLSVAGSTALADDAPSIDDRAEVERGVTTLRVINHNNSTCQVWVNGTLRATIGPSGDTGVLPTGSSDIATEVLANCQDAQYLKKMRMFFNHCDFIIDPAAPEHRLTLGPCT